MPSRFEIEIAPTGYRSLKALKDKKLRHEVAKVIDGRYGLRKSRERRFSGRSRECAVCTRRATVSVSSIG